MIDYQQAQNFILEQKKLALSRGRPENTWFFFHNHVYGCAAIAKVIAREVGLDPHFAALSALLHDIGKIREDIEHRFHGVIGYFMLKDLDEGVARSCLIHTFPFNQIDEYEKCSAMFFDKRDDYDFTAQYLAAHPANDYDRLVQLADSLSNAYGFVTVEQRAEEYAKRCGVPVSDGMTQAIKKLKSYFDRKMGADIYSLYGKIDTTDLFLTTQQEIIFS